MSPGAYTLVGSTAAVDERQRPRRWIGWRLNAVRVKRGDGVDRAHVGHDEVARSGSAEWNDDQVHASPTHTPRQRGRRAAVEHAKWGLLTGPDPCQGLPDARRAAG